MCIRDSPYTKWEEGLKKIKPKGIILSGGPASTIDSSSPQVSLEILNSDVPVLGICYGQQTLCSQLGGKVEHSTKREFGRANIKIIGKSDFFRDFENNKENEPVWMSHGDKVTELPEGFSVIAKSENAPFAAIANEDKRVYGVQFHPEVVHTPNGSKMLENFTHYICGCSGEWTIESFKEIAIERIRKQVGDGTVVCGLSGGVDSSVAAVLLHEAIGKQFSPVLRFQHRDVVGVHLPMETGFHNLAIVSSKQRYPRQARKTALGLFGAGQMMFLKTIVAVDSDQNPDDLELLLDSLNDKVDPREDIIVIEGMVGDSLDPATPYENVQSKILIDATTIPDADPRSDSEGPEGSPKRTSPGWRKGKGKPPGVPDGFLQSVLDLENVSDARLLRPSILVVTNRIEGRPDPRKGMFGLNEELAKEKDDAISQLTNSIWQF